MQTASCILKQLNLLICRTDICIHVKKTLYAVLDFTMLLNEKEKPKKKKKKKKKLKFLFLLLN